MAGRLLVIERKDARKWGHNPAPMTAPTVDIELERELRVRASYIVEADSPEIGRQTVLQQQAFDKAQMDEVRVDVPMTMTQPTTQSEQVADGMTRKPQVSTKKALLSMMKSPRIAVATWATIVFAYVKLLYSFGSTNLRRA